MSLIVEDGTGLADAESYASIATINSYAVAHGLTFVITGGTNQADAEAAARRGTRWLDAYALPRLMGLRTHLRSQALQFPRVGVIDREGNGIASDEIPQEYIDACCEAAIREKASPGALSPDVTPGTVKKRVRVEGAVEVEYAAGTTPATAQRPIATVIDDILAPLLGARRSNYFGTSVRA